MGKTFRISIGALCVAAGIILFILPGSMFVLLGGLMLLSYDVPRARHWLKICQTSMSKSAQKLDRYILNRKLRR